MRFLAQGVFRRCLGILTAAAFAATSPGLSGLEVVAHLSGLVDLTHERQPHFEDAGHSGHTDGCQLGKPAFSTRLPALAAPSLRPLAEKATEPSLVDCLLPRFAARSTGLPRAPPA